MASRAQDPSDLVQCRVRVDEMLDDLAEQHGVDGLGAKRQPAVAEFTADRVRQPGAGAAQGVLGPVDADETVTGEQGAATAAAVPSPQPMSRTVCARSSVRASASMRAWRRLRGVPEATGTAGSS